MLHLKHLSLIVVCILFAACTTTSEPTPDLPSLLAATQTAQADQAERTPVTLLTPTDQNTFTNVAEVKLQWQWHRPLAEDEVFDVRVWHEGEPPYGITWTQETSMELASWLLYQQPGQFFWTVAVLKKGTGDQPAQEISAAPPEHTFTMDAIRLDVMELPPGFTSELYARLPITQPTVALFDPDGALLVLSLDGRVVRLTDDDSDGVAETATIIFEDPGDRMNYAVGMALHEGNIYISDAGRVSFLTDSDSDGVWDNFQPIIEGLPTWQHTFHSNNGIAFGPDGKLYVTIGSTTDHGPLQERFESSVLRMNPDGTGQEIFATGFRNSYDLAFSPDGDLFSADNSPDELDYNLHYLPPEELNHVQQGKNYGFPYVYGIAGSGTEYTAPVTELFTSSATSGLTYYDGDQYPPEYRGVYIAQLGTGAAAPTNLGVSTGRMVVHVSLTPDGEGSFRGTWQPFARFRTDIGIYGPIDVTVGPDGLLYIVEWEIGTIHKILYNPDSAQAAASEVIALSAGEDIYRNGANGAPACITCHLLDTGSAAGVGPSLFGLGEVAASRVAGLTAEEYIRQSILNSNDYVVEGYLAGIMYQGYAGQLQPEQVDALVEYVLSLAAN